MPSYVPILSSQVRNIRKKMIDIIQREVSSTDLKDVVNKLIPDSIARDIEKACQGEEKKGDNVDPYDKSRHLQDISRSFRFARQVDFAKKKCTDFEAV